MKARTVRVAVTCGLGLGIMVGLSGGCVGGCFAPPPEAVLSGRWLLVPNPQTNPPVEDWFLSFDSDGNLTEITFTISGIGTTWNNPTGDTYVEGTYVYVSSTDQGSGLTFEGDLNGDNTVIDGDLSSNLVIGNITVSLSQGPATMTKQ